MTYEADNPRQRIRQENEIINRPSKRVRTKTSQLDIVSYVSTSPPDSDITRSPILRPCIRDHSEMSEDNVHINQIVVSSHLGTGDDSRSDIHSTQIFQANMPFAKRRRILRKSSPENLLSKIPWSNVNMDPHVCVETVTWSGTATPRTLSRTTCPTLAARFPHLVRPLEPT